MSKMHFIALADDLKQEKTHWITQYGESAFTELVNFTCRFCRGQNGRFNESRFRDYVAGDCGPNGGSRLRP